MDAWELNSNLEYIGSGSISTEIEDPLKSSLCFTKCCFFGGPPLANDLKGIDGQLHVTYHIYIDIYISKKV